MGHYNNATICLNGHVVSKYQANYQKFCSKCGKETYSKCPECNSPIHGKYEVDGIVDLSGSYNRPDYCYNCGAPYPWTKIILDNAVMLVSLWLFLAVQSISFRHWSLQSVPVLVSGA